jgi:hypothetical protein
MSWSWLQSNASSSFQCLQITRLGDRDHQRFLSYIFHLPSFIFHLDCAHLRPAISASKFLKNGG